MSSLERQSAKLGLIMQCLLSCAFSEAEEAWLFAAGVAASPDPASPDPAWAEYIYWPDRYGLDGSVATAVAKAFAYQPIVPSTS
jgi:hypothetical protein